MDAETLKFEIEGKYIGQVYETDNAGNVLPKLRGKFEVPKDYVLPIASSARSFDGRYSGAIPKSQIKARVVPKKLEQMESERVNGTNEEISAYNPLVNPSAPQKISYTQDGANSQENSTVVFKYAPN